MTGRPALCHPLLRRFPALLLLTAAFALVLAGCASRDRYINRDADRRMAPLRRSQVEFTTTMGAFVVEVYHNESPVTVENFLQYQEEGHYENTLFHRVIPDFMVQGGGFVQGDFGLVEKPTRPAIRNEASNGLKNRRGTLAMARTNERDSARSQFFINLKDNTELNHGVQGYGYCVFGQVVQGMDVIDRISRVPTTQTARHLDLPVEPVSILATRRLKVSEFIRPSGDPTAPNPGEIPPPAPEEKKKKKFLLF